MLLAKATKDLVINSIRSIAKTNKTNSTTATMEQQATTTITTTNTADNPACNNQITNTVNMNLQPDKLKSWINTVKKKTTRLSTRITASLGLISLTHDEVFEKHNENFKRLEKTIRAFIKNLTAFVDHFENFLLSLQSTSENLSDFYRDKSHQKELDELRRKNKALACEHFHAFKRTIDRQVIAVASQLLQKFSGPHQMISKRSAKLLDYDIKTRETESCRDVDKKAALHSQYVIAKDLYDKINQQLIDELPKFNYLALSIFRECILVLLETRKSLITSYTNQTASLLDTPLMLTYTASDVAFSILMSCDTGNTGSKPKQVSETNEISDQDQDRKDSSQTSGHGTRHGSTNDEDEDDAMAKHNKSINQMKKALDLHTDHNNIHLGQMELSSEFNQLALSRENSSTPLPEGTDLQVDAQNDTDTRYDEPDGAADNTSESMDTQDKQSPELDNSGITDETKSQPTKKAGTGERKKKRYPIYVASWPFTATGPNQLNIASKQPLKLIKASDECGNPDWSLVQDRNRRLGYVPSSYIKRRK